MIEVKYSGRDITDNVDMIQCYHDMYASEQTDTLHIVFDDSDHIWDSWGVKTDDMIEIEYGAIKTGAMYVYTATPLNGLFEIIATSVPSSFKDKNSKAWQKVKLKAMGRDIAKNHGLEFESYGVKDILYGYVMQKNETDFHFFNRICKLEGCAFLVYDKKLIMYYEPYIEENSSVETISVGEDTDYEYSDKSGWLYGSCKIEQGSYIGEFQADNGSSKVYIPSLDFSVNSKTDADRYAKNLLRYANKSAYSGYLYDSILTGYAPASMANLQNDRAPSWDGDIFITHIRNDYKAGVSKIFFRRPLNGY